jgi:predicted aminopeptidase
MKRRMKAIALATAFGAAAVIPGCANLGYYFQAIKGHMDLVRRAQPIAEVLDNPQVPVELKTKLATARRIREYASRELALPANGSYFRYADLERPYAVWNVFATAELSIQPQQWCFLIAGCTSYRGFFSLARADLFGDELRNQGRDVYVGGVPAYSTLGWFDDPVLNTFIHYPESEIARLIFHELAHQVVYVRDDSMFNESFATAVEQEGVRRWLTDYGSAEGQAAFELMQERKQGFFDLIQRYRERLAALYASSLSDEQKRAEKARVLAELQGDYRALKSQWGGFAGFDRWFAQKVNNAQIASVAVYTHWVPAFQALLKQQGSDLALFYDAVKALAVLSQYERTSRLKELAENKTELAASPKESHAR